MVDDVQATIEASYNITATLSAAYPGAGNSNSDPLLELSDGIPIPGEYPPTVAPRDLWCIDQLTLQW